MELHECLFNWKDFYTKKGHKYISARICFPQYFSLSIISVIRNNIPKHKLLIEAYIQILPIIVAHIYDDCIKINCQKLTDVINTKNFSHLNLDDILLLEYYLLDVESIEKYRKYLLEETLISNNKKTLEEYISYLKEINCVTNTPTKSIDTIHSVPSHHYLIFLNTETNHKNNCISFTKHINPIYWGPFYWNVFHTLAKESKMRESWKNDKIEEYLLMFVWVLPFIIPCFACTINYLKDRSQIQEYINDYIKHKDIELLYHNIHQMVMFKLNFISQESRPVT